MSACAGADAMILTVDCGNTRLKWALYDGNARAAGAPPLALEQGSVPVGAIRDLDAPWRGLPQPRAIAIANVAGEAVRAALAPLLVRWPVEPLWARAGASACGVTSRYDDPVKLGIDRWAALIAAWARCRAACLVVSTGTATTIDSLSATGEFPGGRILAGVDLMKKALATNTAGLPLQRGCYAIDPRNTADAIESGCLEAQAGAIERCHARLPAGSSCLITGGAAAAIAARLALTAGVSVVDNLVLEGLLCIAQSAPPGA